MCRVQLDLENVTGAYVLLLPGEVACQGLSNPYPLNVLDRQVVVYAKFPDIQEVNC